MRTVQQLRIKKCSKLSNDKTSCGARCLAIRYTCKAASAVLCNEAARASPVSFPPLACRMVWAQVEDDSLPEAKGRLAELVHQLVNRDKLVTS